MCVRGDVAISSYAKRRDCFGPPSHNPNQGRAMTYLRFKMKYLFALALLSFIGCTQKNSTLGIGIAKQELEKALTEKSKTSIDFKQQIQNKQMLFSLAEPILFNSYGKAQIISEKPYEVYLINGYWVMNGTLPKKMYGGGFLIIISAKNGKVIKLTHYK